MSATVIVHVIAIVTAQTKTQQILVVKIKEASASFFIALTFSR